MNFLYSLQTILEQLAVTAVFTIPLAKRSRAPLRYASALLLMAAMAGFLRLLAPLFGSMWFWAIFYITTFLICWAYMGVCCAISWRDALFGTLWAYTLHNLGFQLLSFIRTYLFKISGLSDLANLFTDLVFYAVLCTAAYFVVVRRLGKGGKYDVSASQALLTVLLVLPFFLLNNFIFNYQNFEDTLLMALFQVFCMGCCLCALMIQNGLMRRAQAEREKDIIAQLWQQQQFQYQLSQKNVELINRKCHDLKHHIAALRAMGDGPARNGYLGELEQAVQLYGAVVKTGNEVLDVVLTEKNFYCESHGISMVCVADGGALDFMNTIDLYTIFGNALDNAIESVSMLEDLERRLINISIYRENKLVMIRIENSMEGTLNLSDGLPISTKELNGYHGYGLKSIRYTVQKYGGDIAVDQENNLFVLRILLPASPAVR